MQSRHHDFKDIRVTQDSEQRLQHSSYTCQSLVGGFMEFFTRKEQACQRGYATIQTEAPERWRQWVHTMQVTLDAKDLDLDFFLQLFDDHFFGGALRCWMTVSLIDRPSQSRHYGKTDVDPDRKGHTLIVVVRPDSNTTSTELIIQHFLVVLLHEMTHVW